MLRFYAKLSLGFVVLAMVWVAKVEGGPPKLASGGHIASHEASYHVSDDGADVSTETASSTLHLSDEATTSFAFSDSEAEFPSRACYHPGWPRKPIVERPGDINRKDCPPERYCISDCLRAGRAHCIAPWAKCSINEKYSAWYVGGGTPWILPGLSRGRTAEEGTWGLDWNGLLRPRRVWLNWSCGREQSLGTYETD